jgi:hypothetical protein
MQSWPKARSDFSIPRTLYEVEGSPPGCRKDRLSGLRGAVAGWSCRRVPGITRAAASSSPSALRDDGPNGPSVDFPVPGTARRRRLPSVDHRRRRPGSPPCAPQDLAQPLSVFGRGGRARARNRPTRTIGGLGLPWAPFSPVVDILPTARAEGIRTFADLRRRGRAEEPDMMVPHACQSRRRVRCIGRHTPFRGARSNVSSAQR